MPKNIVNNSLMIINQLNFSPSDIDSKDTPQKSRITTVRISQKNKKKTIGFVYF